MLPTLPFRIPLTALPSLVENSLDDLSPEAIDYCQQRGISEATLLKYNVRQHIADTGDLYLAFPFYV